MAFAGVLLVAGMVLRPLDREHFAAADYARRAQVEVAEMREELAAARTAPLQAGWAVAPLDLRVGEPLAGYGARRGAGSVGVADPLFARALCLRAGGAEVVLVGVDALLVHAVVARELARLCAGQGLAERGIYLTATHTHCGPGGWGPNVIEQAVCGRFDPESVHRLARTLAGVIAQARGAVRPAEWTWLEMSAPGQVRNRTVKEGPTDASLDALVVRRVEDGATGVFAFYGAHATCHGARQMKFSGDYPGVMVRSLEKEGLRFAAFGAGAVGSQAPVGRGDDAARADEIGVSLARQIRAGLAGVRWRPEVALAVARREVPLPRLQVRVGRYLRLATWVTAGLHGPAAPLQLVRMDEHRLAGLPVEISAMLSAPLRAEAARGGIRLCVTPFNGDYVGYVLPPVVYDTAAYEATMNFLGPWGGDYFVELVRVGVGLGGADAAAWGGVR